MLNHLFHIGYIGAALMLCHAISAHAQATFPLNDTGQNKCYNGSNIVTCAAANAGDSADYPRQDGRFGRDAQAAAGQLTKTGGGAAGFDFTALDASGNTTTNLGSHECVKDNVTGLIWSTQVFVAMTFGMAMDVGSSHNRCGFSTNWRLPKTTELLSIVDNGKYNPAIDTDYFPNTESSYYWTSDTVLSDAWFVHFRYGNVTFASNASSNLVRLVRSGQ